MSTSPRPTTITPHPPARVTMERRPGLDFRPIALLDSDYKIYSRLLLNRLRPFLKDLVSDTQFGFVPGRQVHDALDVFHAMQASVKDGLAPATSLAISLDFAKAYDTLDRPFLLRVLERLGCPPKFIQAVRQMHLATTATYMADSDISDEQRVLNGIRQGCPLAPTLFVLAVDTLYQAVNTKPDATGITLASGAEIRIAGFADDTTLYVPGEAVIPEHLELLREFECASGLGINLTKCVAVALHDTIRPRGNIGIQLAAPNAMNRLLGGQISSTDIQSQVWDLTLQQMRTRLRLAESKTTNVLQRVKLVRSIVLPKFTFVARHHWPTGTQVDRVQRLIKNFVWKGTLALTPAPGRAWMDEDTAALPIADGGLRMPMLTHVLQELSVQVVTRWAAPNEGIRSEIGRTRLRHHKAPDGRMRPSRRPAPRPTLQATVNGTGLQVRKALVSQPREPEETHLAMDLLQHTGKGTCEQYTWEEGRLCIDYEQHREHMRALQRWQAEQYGDLHIAALLEAPVTGEDILLGHDGTPFPTTALAGLAPCGTSIGDVVDIQWLNDDRVAFRCKTWSFPLPDAQARAFRRLCDTIVYNYPAILRNPGPTCDIQLETPSLDVWQLLRNNGNVELWWSPLGNVRVMAGVVSSTAAATSLARHLTSNATLRFRTHVWLDAPRSLWYDSPIPNAPDVRELVGHHSRERALDAVDERKSRWIEMDSCIAQALDDVTWDDILKVPGAPKSHCLLAHRIKSARLPGWTRLLDSVGCPHCPRQGAAAGQPAHIMWTCPMAQRLWAALRARWEPLSSRTAKWTDATFLRNVFSMRLTSMPDLLWDHPALAKLPTPSAADTSTTHQALQNLWRRQTLATFYGIWKWRTDAADREELWTAAQAEAYHDGCLRATLEAPLWPRAGYKATSRHTAAAFDVLRQTIPERPVRPVSQAETDQRRYVLFFDGGSRGNPGPGGSGAVIIATSHLGTQASIVWSAAMSAANTNTTNNQAEYDGVVTGLRAAREHGWAPLEVVGDSQLILGSCATTDHQPTLHCATNTRKHGGSEMPLEFSIGYTIFVHSTRWLTQRPTWPWIHAPAVKCTTPPLEKSTPSCGSTSIRTLLNGKPIISPD